MTSKRTYFVMLGCIGLLAVGLIGGAYGINTLLSKQNVSLLSLKAKSNALAKEQIVLSTDKKQVAKYTDLDTIVKAVVPQDKDQAEAVREIVNIANQNSITLSSISFPASTLGTSTIAATGATVANPSAASAPPLSSPANPKTTALSQLQLVPGITGVYDLQIVVQSDTNTPVQYDQFIAFLTALEHNRRTAQVSTITLQPADKNPDAITFNLTLDEYIKP